jgi:hypothetical protein
LGIGDAPELVPESLQSSQRENGLDHGTHIFFVIVDFMPGLSDGNGFVFIVVVSLEENFGYRQLTPARCL